MQTTIYINLCGRIIQITDDAFKKQLEYIETLHNYFITEQDRFEIINDIESRMAELMQDKINRRCSFVDNQCMDNIIRIMGTISDFEQLDNDNWEMPDAALEKSNTSANLNIIRPLSLISETH